MGRGGREGVSHPEAPPDSGLRLGGGREFDLIRGFYHRAAAAGPRVRVGPGDDAAVLALRDAVLSTDLSVEDVHFRRDWLSPEEIGYRAAAAALSDLAAMAARPVGVLVSLAVTEADAGAFATGVMEGVVAAASDVGGELLGGDLSRSPGPLVIDVVALGEAERPILRSGAMPGDELWVTGVLGGSGLAVEQLARRGRPSSAALSRYASPRPRVREALWLAERGIPRAMLDLSDGLVSDSGHLSRSSGVAVIIDLDAVPIDPTVTSARAQQDALRLALSGGEDYELLLASPPGSLTPHLDAFQAEFGVPLTRVGRCETGEDVFVMEESGVRTAVAPTGFQHFGGTG